MADVKYSEDGKVLIRARGIVGHFVVPEGVTVIGESAFSLCRSLTNIELPNSVTEIGMFAFYGCTSLTNIKLPNLVTEIDLSVFRDCRSLTNIEIPNSVTRIYSSAFSGCSSLTSIELPHSVTDIGWLTFQGCRSLTNIKIPNSVEKIGLSVFSGCSSLTSIELPNSVKEIGGDAFQGCCSLTSIELPNSVKEIGGFAFSGCSLLKEPIIVNELFVKLPEDYEDKYSIPLGIKVILSGAFEDCSSLTNTELPNSVAEIGMFAFDNCPIQCFFVDKDNPNFTSVDGALFDMAKESIIRFPSGKEIDSYRVPYGVVSIESCAFGGAINLQELFLPDTIRKIGSFVFLECENLTQLHLRVGDPNVISIDDDAFKDFALDECTLYVPVGTCYGYRHHPVFGQFKEVIIER